MKTEEEKKSCRTEDASANIALITFFAASLISSLILLSAVSSVIAAEYQVHEGESIQTAINIANSGDTIIVHNGSYTENVLLNRSNLILRSANGSAVTIVEPNRTDMHVFEITNQINVTLEGFTIRNASAALNSTGNNILTGQAISALTLPVEEVEGYITISSAPSGADILIDGWPIGAMTPYTIPAVPGTYTITLTIDGYQDWTKRVRVTACETSYIDATLSKASGSISITSTPSSAGISFDGIPINAITPYTIPNVESGYHNIKLSLTGYQEWTKKVHVAAGETAHIHGTLSQATGSISVTSTPSGASIYVDTYLGWSYKGKTPNTITGVSPDYYTIKLTLSDYQDWSKEVHVAAGETAQIHATLSQATGSISITSTPTDALIYLDDRYRGKTPHTITSVSPGYHILKLNLVDYLDWSNIVHVAAGETAFFDVQLTPIPGYISVISTPPGAKIYLDDRYRGKTPHTITEVSSGYHTLRLTLAGYLDWSTNLQVSAGETSDVTAIMLTSFSPAGVYMNNASNCVIKNNRIINCGHGILIASGINTEIYENCFIDNEPQAWDDGTANNWIGNYWSPPPGGPSIYIIAGAAGSEDKDPLDECPQNIEQ